MVGGGHFRQKAQQRQKGTTDNGFVGELCSSKMLHFIIIFSPWKGKGNSKGKR